MCFVGNDVITAKGFSGRISGGAGDDILSVGRATGMGTRISGDQADYRDGDGAGDDGNDSIDIRYCDYCTVDADGGDDVVSIGRANSLKGWLGDGDDTLTIDKLADGSHIIKGGDGDDDIHVKSAEAADLTIDGGAGDDTIAVDSYDNDDDESDDDDDEGGSDDAAGYATCEGEESFCDCSGDCGTTWCSCEEALACCAR